MYDFSTEIKSKDILEKITEYDVYAFYIGRNFKINSKISSPFRQDTNPSFSVFVSKKTRSLLFKDFATGDTGNCFKFVQLVFDLQYRDALIKIYNDIISGNISKSHYGSIVRDNYEPPRTEISIKRRYYTKDDIEYWGSFNISKGTLVKYNVLPVDAVWVNDKIRFTHYKGNPVYAYSIFNRFKVYKPFDKKNRFISNCSMYDVQGFEQLPKSGELLIITKSLKDCMVLYELGYNAISANSENTLIPKKVISNLRKRFSEIILFYDNDEGGLCGVERMKEEYGFNYILIPDRETKDISDYVKKHGSDKANNLINKLINNERKD